MDINREKVDKELHFVNRVLDDIRMVEVPKLVYPEEKEVVRQALLDYRAKLQDKLYGN